MDEELSLADLALDSTEDETQVDIAEPPRLIEWSHYQKEVFKFIQEGKGNGQVVAVAGSGKTTLLVECAKLIPLNSSAIFVAFGKDIATELERRLPPHVPARTTHSFGFRALLASGLTPKVDSRKNYQIMDRLVEEREMEKHELFQLSVSLNKLVSAAKGIGIVPESLSDSCSPLTSDEKQNWIDLMDYYSLEISEDDEDRTIELSREILTRAITMADTLIDFDDQLYLPVVMGLALTKFDWIFVDEAQDLNLLQHKMIKGMLKEGSRVLYVGDPNQAIFSFRGASSQSMFQLQKMLSAKELPLSICYRCAQSIVTQAKGIVPQIEWAPGAIEGEIHSRFSKETLPSLNEKDVIICPFNAPLVKAAFTLIRHKVPCKVLGRDIGTGLTKLLDKMKSVTVGQAEEKLNLYYAKEQRRMGGDPRRLSSLTDRVETLQVFLAEAEAGDSVDSVKRTITTMFQDQSNVMTLSTIHKMKGREKDRVFLLDSRFLSGSTFRGRTLKDWEMEARRNLLYVAITRARRELVFISSDHIKMLEEQ